MHKIMQGKFWDYLGIRLNLSISYVCRPCGRILLSQNSGLFFAIFLIGCQSSIAHNQVCFRQHCFDVEVVSQEKDLQRGLLFRQSLAQNAGMVFIFSHSGKHSFWMKDTLIPLDMIWMDYARRVVHIEQNVPPCHRDPCPTYTPQNDALYVLEINANLVPQIGLHIGDEMEFRLKEFIHE